MARKKQHPNIGRYVAVVEHYHTSGEDSPTTYDTPEEALKDAAAGADENEVIYVYAVVGVKLVKAPAIVTEDYLP